jgi:oxygen-independent coproporphyrinogen-3 oxidase
VERRWNEREYAAWVRRLCAGVDPVAGAELLTSENQISEQVYLGLRTSSGLTVDDAEAAHVERWLEAGWARLEAHRLRLTPHGWLRLDALAASLTMLRSR